MNTLILYDTLYGNTKQVAQNLADALRAFGQVQVARVDLVQPTTFQDVDLLILGSPTQGFRSTPVMQSFLAIVSSQARSNLAVACFDTRFRGRLWKNSAAPHMAKRLHILGVELLVPPESFFVQSMKKEGPLLSGEAEHAATWAHLLSTKVEAAHLVAKTT